MATVVAGSPATTDWWQPSHTCMSALSSLKSLTDSSTNTAGVKIATIAIFLSQ